MLSLIIIIACNSSKNDVSTLSDSDSIENALIMMIEERERAMINKDVETAISQFSDDITWINSQGYFFEGIEVVTDFHHMMAGNDSLDYYYEAGKPRIRILDEENALAYYSWKMFWYRKDNPVDTTMKEIGLMTLNARKYNDTWKWNAITNQHTPWFYDSVEPVIIE
ncbi:MAG: hypothetical protein HKN68_07655 [Saprospiraceae bacterium]|nr:hypothetical protein [Saprospiraceae bacterium]